MDRLPVRSSAHSGKDLWMSARPWCTRVGLTSILSQEGGTEGGGSVCPGCIIASTCKRMMEHRHTPRCGGLE